MLKLAHIINPVKVSEKSDLFVAQPITFETIRRAKEYAGDDIQIELFSAQYQEDRVLLPTYINTTPNLEQSVLDIGQFKKQRKLPLIKDILDRLYDAAPKADYLIYTNVDISVQPFFYTAVNKIIEMGFDAFVINRRTITNAFNNITELNEMYSQVGDFHPGADCFVFKRSLYTKFNLGTACIGANYIGKVINLNLQNFAKKYKWFKDLHLTFHIGDDRSWKVNDYLDYDEHNKNELHKILSFFESSEILNVENIDDPYLRLFFEDTQNKEVKSLINRLKRLFKK